MTSISSLAVLFLSNTISTYSEWILEEDDNNSSEDKGVIEEGKDESKGDGCFEESLPEEEELDRTTTSVHCATTVMSCTGILSGLGTHPLNVYTSIIGFSG